MSAVFIATICTLEFKAFFLSFFFFMFLSVLLGTCRF